MNHHKLSTSHYAFFVLIILLFAGCKVKNQIKKSDKDAAWPMFQNSIQRHAKCKVAISKKPKIKWKTYVGIQGYLNCPVIAEDVYVSSSGDKHNTPDKMDGIYALDKNSGKILWHFKTENDACGISYDQEMIYSTGDDGVLRCIEAKSGKQIWKLKRGDQLYAQPLILNGSVYIGDAGGNVLAVNQFNGKIIWESKVSSSNIRGGLCSDGEFVYAGFVGGTIVCFDQQGKLVWKTEGTRKDFGGRKNVPLEIYACPTISDGLLIIPFARDTEYPHPAVHAYNIKTGLLVWKANDEFTQTKHHGNIRSSVSIYQELVIYSNPYSNHLIALNKKDGKQLWKIRFGDVMFPQYGSSVIANNTLLIGRFDGSFNSVDLLTKKVNWQLLLKNINEIEERPVEYGKNFREGTGSWETHQGQPIFASPAIDFDGSIYVGTGEGWLVGFK